MVSKSLDKLICDFFWEGSRGNGGMHNVNWDKSYKTQFPKLLEGNGIGNFKWRWSFGKMGLEVPS